nr:hypothetical protein GCM10020093_080230 [Planobispora longispora]
MNAHSVSDEELAAEFAAIRPRLVGVAYGLLGTVDEADDVVQDAWLRLIRADRSQIDDVTGWLVVTVSRLALDVLRSARVRREKYVGPWLPEPVVTDGDPADRVTLAESMSMAMLVVLESLSPAERTAFVLHDVFGLPFAEVGRAVGRTAAACRQLAARARRHVSARAPGSTWTRPSTAGSWPPSRRRRRGGTWRPCWSCSTPTWCCAATAAAW